MELTNSGKIALSVTGSLKFETASGFIAEVDAEGITGGGMVFLRSRTGAINIHADRDLWPLIRMLRLAAQVTKIIETAEQPANAPNSIRSDPENATSA